MARLSKFHGLLGNHNPAKINASTLRRVFLHNEATKVRWMAKHRGSLADCSVLANNDRVDGIFDSNGMRCLSFKEVAW
jgi:hypothetical protein